MVMGWWNTLKQTIKTKYIEIKQFTLFVLQHFAKDGCAYRASALAFTSLLAVVPLMIVGFAIFSSFPVFQQLSEPLQLFIFNNFVPATGNTILLYLQQFSSQVSKLSIWGVLILFIMALLVMVTVENAMNTIWRAHSSRKGVGAFLLYWAILSLSPILLGLSLAGSSYLISMPFVQEYRTPLFLLLNSVPFLLSWTGFTFLYVVVPNCSVKINDGIIGGLIAAILFELAKQAFAAFLSQYDTYQLLYGAFATIPIFFIWVYWGWIITLLGAEITYARSVHYQRRPGKPLDGFTQAMLWLFHLWHAHHEGHGLSRETLINTSMRPFEVNANTMINHLIRLNLIHYTAKGELMLSRDLSQINLYELMQLLPFRLPCYDDLEKEPNLTQWESLIQKEYQQVYPLFKVSLHDLFCMDEKIMPYKM